MIERQYFETHFRRMTDEFAGSPTFKAIEDGSATRKQYDDFIASVIRSHLRSPQIVAFLFAVAPPGAAATLEENLLEELGEGGEPSHPSLLHGLAAAAGLALEPIEELAILDLRRLATEALLYGTLKEVGLGALVQVCAFEWMLSRTTGRMAVALASHRGLDPGDLQWFMLHSEVDIQHAEEGLDNLVRYVDYYEFAEDDARSICEMALRENIFIKRYFGELSVAEAGTEVRG